MSNVLRSKFNDNKQCPHCLIELSSSEFNTYVHQEINLKGLKKQVDKALNTVVTTYNSVQFGAKINEDYINYKVGGNKNEKMRRIDMARMRKKYLYILGKKDEILNTFDNSVVFDGNMKGKEVENKKQKGLGYLVLFFSTFNYQKTDHDFMWTNNQIDDLKHSKNIYMHCAKFTLWSKRILC